MESGWVDLIPLAAGQERGRALAGGGGRDVRGNNGEHREAPRRVKEEIREEQAKEVAATATA